MSENGRAAPTRYLADLPEFMHGHRKKTLFFIARLRRHAESMGLERRQMKVLELGCGNGRIVTLPVAEQGFDVLGVDIHLPSIEAARAHNRLEHARFECGDFSEAPTSGDFHAVILSDVLEHVREPGRMLEVAAAALHRDGILLVSIPNGYGPYEIEQFLIRTGILRLPLALVRRGVRRGVRVKQAVQGVPQRDLVRPAYNVDSPHVQQFTLGRFRSLLGRAGFRVEHRQNGAWFGGDLTYFLFYFAPRLVTTSLRIADALPAQLVSTWYFQCRRTDVADLWLASTPVAPRTGTPDYKAAAIEQWTADPCGSSIAEGDPGSRSYFESLVRGRFEYGPWMPEALGYDETSGLRVLDVGCGQGIDVYRYALAGAQATGVDLTPRHVELARAHVAAMGLEAEIVEGDAESLPFGDAAFDRVSSNGVLHHTPDLPASLREIGRVLRPGGEARIIVYNRRSFHYWLKQVLWDGVVHRGLVRERSMAGVLSAGVEVSSIGARPLVRVYSPAGIRAAMVAAGFDNVTTTVRHFRPGDTPITAVLAGRLPVFENPAFLDRVGRIGGWYVVARGNVSQPK